MSGLAMPSTRGPRLVNQVGASLASTAETVSASEELPGVETVV